TPATMVPRSVSDVCMPSLLLSLCRSSTFCATTSPLKFCQGPFPIRSRALTGPPCAPALVLRYARQVLLPAPAAVASVWQWRSAPSRPPRSPPLPGPVEVTKKVILGDCGGCCCACAPTVMPTDNTDASNATFNLAFIWSSLRSSAPSGHVIERPSQIDDRTN